MPKADIVMYARERFCPDVKRSRDHLSELGLSWLEHDIESDDAAAEELQALAGRRNVPTVIVGDTMLVEPSNDELDDALRNAGFDIK